MLPAIKAAILLTVWLLAPTANADEWADLVTISSTQGLNANRLCMGAPGHPTDIGCPTNAPYYTNDRLFVGMSSGDADSSVLGLVTHTDGNYLEDANTHQWALYARGDAYSSVFGGIDHGADEQGDFGISYWNGTAWKTGLVIDASTTHVGLGGILSPTTGLDVNGTLRIANGGETCDAARAGAIRFASETFDFCDGANGWRSLAAVAGATSTMVSLTDVSASSPQIGDVLQWNPGLSKWVAVSPSALISGSQVAFSVNKNNVDQTVTASTWNKLTWNTEEFDTNNNFASNRFTATIPGKYLFTAQLTCNSASYCGIALYKDGTGVNATYGFQPASGAHLAHSITQVIDLGVGDYVEVYGTSMGDTTISGWPLYTRFSGALINAVGGGAGGGAANLGGLTDVTLSSPQAGQALVYDGSKWINASAASASDRITSSTTAAVIANQGGGTVSFTLGGTAGAAYLHPAIGLVAKGVSTTGTISGTNGYFSDSVGIGTAPDIDAARLQVTGDIRLGSGVGNGDGWLYANPSGTASILYIGNGTSRQWDGSDSSTGGAMLQLWSNGSFRPGDASLWAGKDAAGDFGYVRFLTSNTERVRVTQAGDVGIGTINPAATLDVSGSIMGQTVQVTGGDTDTCTTTDIGKIRLHSGRLQLCAN